jgi:hypothetical protein
MLDKVQTELNYRVRTADLRKIEGVLQSKIVYLKGFKELPYKDWSARISDHWAPLILPYTEERLRLLRIVNDLKLKIYEATHQPEPSTQDTEALEANRELLITERDHLNYSERIMNTLKEKFNKQKTITEKDKEYWERRLRTYNDMLDKVQTERNYGVRIADLRKEEAVLQSEIVYLKGFEELPYADWFAQISDHWTLLILRYARERVRILQIIKVLKSEINATTDQPELSTQDTEALGANFELLDIERDHLGYSERIWITQQEKFNKQKTITEKGYWKRLLRTYNDMLDKVQTELNYRVRIADLHKEEGVLQSKIVYLKGFKELPYKDWYARISDHWTPILVVPAEEIKRLVPIVSYLNGKINAAGLQPGSSAWDTEAHEANIK